MATQTPNDKAELKIKPVLIEQELKTSFLDYAMSVVVSRAIPDIRDGLKPVHRRVLYAMYQQGFHHNKPYHKSVRVVGDVLGKYHPHGDQAVYNTMVGMVQDFSKRYPLLDGQGNWGSVDGDNAAAMRYTEVRMEKIAQELLADLDKETVKFVPNFDESTVEPVVLPSKLPHLLINGTTGIAVGMATSIPPHNLGEVVDACLLLLENPHASDEEIFAKVPAPDFPTGGIICGRGGVIKAYKTGRGNLILRGVVEVEETKKGTSLVITELPYMVNKATLAVQIADLLRDKIVEGISNIKDESDKKGMRLVLEIKRGESPQVILNQLYKHTPLQTSVNILMLGLLDNRPLVFSLRQLLEQFLYHRREVIYKRTVYELKRAQDREHLLTGFIIALKNIDEVVVLIKQSSSSDEAITKLNKRFLLTAEQAKAILEMRLQRLTGLEQDKIYQEMEELKKTILYLKSIIENEEVLKKEIFNELVEIKNEYADPRRSRIEGAIDILTEADLIPDEEVVVTLTHKGYIKRVPLNTYGLQHRGGKGKMGMATLEGSEDLIQDLFVAKNHDELLFFTNLGRVYSMQVFEVPEASRIAKGRAVINLLPLAPEERVVKLLCTRDLGGKNLVMLTKDGIIKRTDASEFAKIRSTGIRAATLKEGDELVFCALSTGSDSIIIATALGQGIHFKEDEVRVMGRQAAGVIGIRMKNKDYVVGMEVVANGGDILFATENGYGKRVSAVDFRVAHRGGLGVRTIPTTNRNGKVIGLVSVTDRSNILLIDKAGKIIRLSSAEVRTMGRQAQGVRLIRLDEGQKLSSIVAFEEEDGGSDVSSSSNNSSESIGSGSGSVKKDVHVAMQALEPVDSMQYETAGAEDDFVDLDDVIPALAARDYDNEGDPFAQF
ncbi:DNA gyrase subunit A [Candidatus Dependentiae bacterium Noda2021]|nr:DNA gyrase subunit A [Candidatus Dependentiae bacterium Noda2021]